jgi:CheY-like chemotaxis protein
MVHGLAEQSGGRLRITSRLGEGSTAEMWLPAAVGPGGAPERAPEHGVLADAGCGRRLKILAVDDDNLVLMNTTAMLEDMGHVVLEAHSGTQALQILKREGAIDLMVTDQAMPNMTGLQLAEIAHALHPELPVILATGYAELPPGADPSFGRLAKPFTQAELAEAVDRLMSEHAV